MSDTTIICPNCKSPIELTEALAAPFIIKAQENASALLKKGREALELERAALRTAQASFEETLKTKLEAERAKLAASLREQAISDVEKQLDQLRVEKEAAEKKAIDGRADRMNLLKQLQEAKGAAEKAQEEAQKTLLAERDRVIKEAKESAALQARLELAGRDQTIEGLKRKIDELKSRAEQGSQQLQGEAQEVVLEEALEEAFPGDTIDEVPKGVNGADCLQRIFAAGGHEAGTIIWESKRTKHWSDSWIKKLKDDMQKAGVDVAVIVSSVLPEDVGHFQRVDGVWVTDFQSAIPLAAALRQGLLDVARARRAAEGLESKAGEVYEYVTGSAFRQRIERMLETYTEMAADLKKEQAALNRIWAKRQAQLQELAKGTVSVVGEIQGIAGGAALEIETVELRALAAAEDEGQG